MRVGLYIPGIDSHSIGAPTKYQINLARALGDVYNVELYLLHHREVHDLGIKAKEIIIRQRTSILWELTLRKYHLDIVHFNSIPCGWRMFFPLLNCGKVVTVHGGFHWLRKGLSSKYDRRRLLEPRLIRLMDAIIFVSNYIKNVAQQCTMIPNSKINVVYEGVSPIYKVRKDMEYVKEKYCLDKPFILHVSNFSFHKNPRLLLKCFSELMKQGFKLNLVIAGGRWKNNQFIKKSIEELNTGSHVKILGYVPEEDLVALYNLAELFFFPSLTETFGFPIVEAMACGTPVVTSESGSIPEISGDAALLCNPYDYHEFVDAIKQILENEELRQEMIMKGLKNAKRFSWERCALETTRIYEQLLVEETKNS